MKIAKLRLEPWLKLQHHHESMVPVAHLIIECYDAIMFSLSSRSDESNGDPVTRPIASETRHSSSGTNKIRPHSNP